MKNSKRHTSTAGTGTSLMVGRFAAALVLFAWGALAATQALAGWNNLVSVLTGAWLLMAASLLLYGSKPARRESFRDGPMSVVISIAFILLPLSLTVLLRMWPIPVAAAAWAVIMSLVFTILMFDVRWLARVVALTWAGAGAAAALIATLSMVLVSLQRDGNPLSGLQLLPTDATRVAAVLLAAVAPISLSAVVYVLHKEWTGRDRKSQWEDDIDGILKSRRQILDYLRVRRQGAPPDGDFERRSLIAMRLTTLDLAEIISALVDERNLPEDDVYAFLSTGGPASLNLALLFMRVRTLARQFGEVERFKLLSTGVVGDRSEIGPLPREFDTVGLVMKLCNAFEISCVEQPEQGMAPGTQDDVHGVHR